MQLWNDNLRNRGLWTANISQSPFVSSDPEDLASAPKLKLK